MRFKSRSRALAASALAASLGLAGLTLAAAPASAEPAEIIRVAGATRYGTAVEAATTAYPGGAADVVLASGEAFPDALSAGGFAGSLDAPILLTPQDRLDDATLAGLEELGADNVWVMGGTAAISDDVVDALEAEGFNVVRTAGADRFETAAMTAMEIGGETAVLANGFGFADALAISPGAHALELPILLTGADELNEDAAGYLEDVDTVVIVGGTAVVSQDIEDGLEADGKTVVRLAGATRYESAVAIAEFHFDNGFEDDELVMATGENFADALAGGPMASQLNAPLVLTQTNVLTPATETFIEGIAPALDTLYILGGTAAITDDVADAAAAAADEGAPASNTSRPELVSASIVQTTAQGTTVRYTFDEALTGANVDVNDFFVYNFSSTGAPADTATTAQVDAGNTSSVLVTFPNIDSAALASQLSVATVEVGAVRGLQGVDDTNIIGDAALNPGGTATLTAGTTAAPDLVSVGNFRANPADVNQTLVDFTFDEAAFNNGAGYHLVSTDGVNDNGTGAAIAGNGTTVHVVAFQNGNLGPDSTVTITSGSVARGYVEAGTVDDLSGAGGNANPLQAADVANSGNSETPDLVSAIAVRNQPDSDNLTPWDTIDAILFTFDEPVLEPVATAGLPTPFDAFQAYLSDGSELSGINAVRSTANDTQVAVIFGEGGTLDLAVGASVLEGAVQEGTGSQARDNQEDEVGLANVGSGPTTVSGRTAGPDLIDVAVTERRDPFGTLIGARVTYTFDEDVVLDDETQLFIVLADGVQYTCDGGFATGTTEDTDSTVRCDSFGTATTTQILSAAVGTVGNGAVLNQAGGTPALPTPGTETNPEGAEAVS